MEKLYGTNSRQSSIHSIIHREIEHLTTDRLGPSATMAATSAVSPTSMYTQPPPPYSSGWPVPSISGLISPPESRRTSDNTPEHPPPIQTSQPHRPSLPSIHEALTTAAKPKPYTSPVSATAPPSHPLPYAGPQPARPFPPAEHPPYPGPPARQPSPPRPAPPPANPPFARPEPASFSEAPRHAAALQAALAPPNPYAAPRYEAARYEQDPRAQERPPSGYAQPPPPPPQPYAYGAPAPPPPPPGQMAPLAPSAPVFNHPRYEPQDRRGPYEASTWPKEEPPERFKQGLKRVLDSYSFENNLAEINTDSSMIANWSAHYNAILSEQQPSSHSRVPDRMPSMESVDDMIRHQEKLAGALQQMKAMIYEQAQNTANQRLREQGARGLGDDYELGMYEDDMKSHYGSESKKRRGRAAPPGRCHSCNRAETPEWRRGPDGARTLCNACGLHYAKLTRKNTLNMKQGSNSGGPLRPKSTDDTS
ncbi:hypothetical protein PZA11_004111 [Diplocarpon coronariae]